jgi:hypothetical protein
MSMTRSLVVPLAVVGLLTVSRTPAVWAHGGEARYVEEVKWTKPRITKTLALSYSELGPGAGRGMLVMRTIAGRLCATGAILGVDVDDAYAFDIDETVTLRITYAPAYSKPFAVSWDANGGEGLGRVQVDVQPGEPLREVSLTLNRARLAGQGSYAIDIAIAGGSAAICDIAIERSNTTRPPAAFGRVRLEIRDAASGGAVPARVGLYDESGRLPLPSDNALTVHRFTDEVKRLFLSPRAFWPSPNRQVFYVDGNYEGRVPAGAYDLVVTKGLEYKAVKQRITVRPDTTTTVVASLERVANMPAAGWYSSDAHIHLGRDAVRDENVWRFAAAEDVHLGNLVQMGNLSRTHFDQPAWGEAGRYQRGNHVVLSAQEDPRTVQHGHTLHHNLRAPVHLSTDEYFSYQSAFEEARRLGGTSGYAHHGELFNGRRGLALDVPFGIVDFIEVLQNGRLATEGWYGFLNLGYKILPAAGSDWPYMDVPGAVRSYAKIQGPFNADSWFAAYRQGNVFVTNGPLLEFSVNGSPIGAELRVERGSTLRVVAEATMNPEIDTLSHIELVAHGDVVATAQANGQSRVTLETQLAADRSKWLAIRAWGMKQNRNNMTVGHTAPIYVLVDGQRFWKAEAVPGLVAEQLQRLDEFMTASVDPRGDLEPWETLELMQTEWERQRAVLAPRVQEARARYQQLLSAAPPTAQAGNFALLGVLAVVLTARRLRQRQKA